MSAGTIASWVIDALIASTLLMGAVLLVRGPVRRAFGPGIAYALWALPALRLLLPPLPAGWWQAQAAAPVTQASATIVVYLAPVTRSTGPSLGTAVAIAWAVGGALFLGWQLIRHARFCRAVLVHGEQVDQQGGIRVIASAAAPGPLAFGVVHRYVAFPRDFADRYDADERALALQHEFGHHERRDLLANWAALAFLALHWFNPLAWRAFRAFRADQELANDARVLARCAPEARHAYGRAIVKAAHGRAFSAACHLHTIADLKGRLKMLATSRRSRRRLAAGAAAVILLGAGGLGLTASSSAAEQIRVSLKTPLAAVAPVALVQDGPQPPAPPGPTYGGSGGRHVAVVRQNGSTLVSVTENGRTARYEGAAAEAWLAAHPTPAPPAPVRSVRRITVVENGRPHTYQGAEADAWAAAHPRREPPVPPVPHVDPVPPVPPVRPMPPIPEVTSANCSARGPAVEQSERGGRQRIVICTNRIERMAREGAETAASAERIEREAKATALASLERSRTAIAIDRNLSDEQRREALADMDEAINDLRAEQD